MLKTKIMKYTTDGKYYVFCEGIIIAKSYIGTDGYEVRILQGMPRSETWDKIMKDCPEFAQNNGMKPNHHPRLFTK